MSLPVHELAITSALARELGHDARRVYQIPYPCGGTSLCIDAYGLQIGVKLSPEDLRDSQRINAAARELARALADPSTLRTTPRSDRDE